MFDHREFFCAEVLDMTGIHIIHFSESSGYVKYRSFVLSSGHGEYSTFSLKVSFILFIVTLFISISYIDLIYTTLMHNVSKLVNRLFL